MATAVATSVNVRDFDAVLFDLDGVVTDTAKSHAATWKRLFDDFLRRHAERSGEAFVPFDIEGDYLRYVDGKPRYDGAKDFLESRGIDIPYGDPGDAPGDSTICAVGNRKNELFQEHLEEHGVDVFPATIRLINAVRAQGLKTAIISSSKNCEPVLRAAGIAHLFDAKVDGADLAELGLAGKPDPAAFLWVAKALGVPPSRAVVVEDATAGVEAGREGGFGLVIGVDRRGEGGELLERGADLVVHDLEEIVLEPNVGEEAGTSSDLPSALDVFETIAAQLDTNKTAVFLDYDGTLTPIVEKPEDAVLSDEMRASIVRLMERYPVAVISGRDLSDVKSRVGIDGIFYAGSHGFEIEGPAGFEARHEAGNEFLPTLDEVEQSLHNALDEIRGAQIERKRYSIAVHYRRVQENDVPKIAAALDEVLSRHGGLRRTHGKKVFDLQPAIDWHKGRAVEWLMSALKLDVAKTIAIYIGDDRTDEDVFTMFRGQRKGVGIIVADESSPRKTAADYVLRNQEEVAQFLRRLVEVGSS